MVPCTAGRHGWTKRGVLGPRGRWSRREQKTEEDVKLERTKQQDLTWFYASIFGAPVLVLAAGVLISRRSRVRGGKA